MAPPPLLAGRRVRKSQAAQSQVQTLASATVATPTFGSRPDRAGVSPRTTSPATGARAALPAAVLWDMDGTLIDAEPQWIEAQRRCMQRHGGAWSHEQGLQLVGRALPVAGLILAQHLAESTGVQVSPEEVVTDLLDEVINQLASGLIWRPGAIELLDELYLAEVPCAMVTMSYRRLASMVASHLPGRFRVLVCGDEVRCGKPSPDPYLQAAEMLGLPAQDCLAIEDSPPGVASAEAAGCQVLACPYLAPIPADPARTVVASLTEVDLPFLARILSSPRGCAL